MPIAQATLRRLARLEDAVGTGKGRQRTGDLLNSRLCPLPPGGHRSYSILADAAGITPTRSRAVFLANRNANQMFRADLLSSSTPVDACRGALTNPRRGQRGRCWTGRDDCR